MRFGTEIDRVEARFAAEVKQTGRCSIDTALAMLDCSHSPDTIALIESAVAPFVPNPSIN